MSQPESDPSAREILIDARGLEHPEPLERVLAAVDLLRPEQRIRFLIHREPLPLYALLEAHGCQHSTVPLNDGSFELLITRLSLTP